MVVGAVQGASCFGPAYEFALLANADLRKRKIRDRVPMTFVTSEPYIGHLGLGGVGDTKGLLEIDLRDRDIRWITNAKIDRVDARRGRNHRDRRRRHAQASASAPVEAHNVHPRVPRRRCLMGGDGKGIPASPIRAASSLVDKYQRNPTFKNVFAVGVCIAIPPYEQTPVPVGVPKTGYMIESMVTAVAENIASLIAGREPQREADLERRLPRRFRQ